jgi:hypothetical protein
VSNASDDFPDPETPLTTVSLPCGISQSMFFRLCVRAPRIWNDLKSAFAFFEAIHDASDLHWLNSEMKGV